MESPSKRVNEMAKMYFHVNRLLLVIFSSNAKESDYRRESLFSEPCAMEWSIFLSAPCIRKITCQLRSCTQQKVFCFHGKTAISTTCHWTCQLECLRQCFNPTFFHPFPNTASAALWELKGKWGVGGCLGDGAYPNCRRLKAGSAFPFNAGATQKDKHPFSHAYAHLDASKLVSRDYSWTVGGSWNTRRVMVCRRTTVLPTKCPPLHKIK